ncbi:PREDICTED: myosin phosphatase Rho-interacting protein isoform X2 [Ceratotherium simum simum]|uniref:Myosin phosphatase Rho-interacting protein isoform X2 n=1 Tax=Ceratotherium simum simum TaxID=73337 RepID=A0ABM1CZE4_CERSS|nr:PREDICTED: myosin phosphatase Rho-interacting protein isoform X2 [Ceratotherium simum simum]XP_014644925.1 PREDICTED: myosin phosphatase Rho-interacting protein isoform X2 [Ceratotherium simum simum]XP_014644926.1 PREDICTED: myosin phosphatase Rho-interacting protein isoform X2 [Ceratotherium simum simum]
MTCLLFLLQAKPIYGGWLLLAPDGTDFDNPVHRSRKWQRRFFILYEHGLLRYALDEMPTTLPQGTINMNQCTDVVDGEGRTGQKFSLCILTPEKEHFIRAETKEIISGWLEMLMVYPRTNKQNQKKKRKVEPPTPQEPGPAKMAVTSSSSIPSAEKVPTTKSTLWQEEMRAKDQPDGSSPSPAQSPSQSQPPASALREPGLESKDEEGTMSSDRMDCGRKVRVESGYFSLEKTKQDSKAEEQQLPPPLSPPSPSTPNNRYSGPGPPSQELGHPLPSSGPRPPSRMVCSSSLGSLDAASRPPAHMDSGSAGGQGAERPGRTFAFKASRQYAALADVPKAIRISHREAFQVERRRLERRTRARSPGREEVARLFGNERRRSQVIEKFEALDIEKAEHMETTLSAGPSPSSDTRQGRSEKRAFPRKRDLPSEAPTAPLPDASASPLSPHRRAKSLDRRSTESSLTPDLLNFKKGWLTKQYEDGQWKKHWFVLADQSLRYYRDSVAEEAADLDGEIDLSTCYDVTEYPVQRNYGFQIHTKEGEFTLSAMTSGIRRNWIQTIMKHVHPTSAPDVTSSLPEEKNRSSSSYEACPRLSDKQDGEHGEPDAEQKRSRARERRREGRSKTFDWAEFRPIQQALAQEKASATRPSDTRPEAEPGELERERARRREERRKRFGMLDAVDGSGADDAALRMEVDRSPGLPPAADLKTQNVHVEIEQRWHQVETTPLREEKQVPIAPLHLSSSEDGSDRLSTHELTSLLEKELEQSQKEASDLLEQNRLLQDQLRVALGREQSAREGYVLQTEVATSPSGAWQRLHRVNQDLQSELEAQCQRQELITQQIQSLKRSYGEAKDAIRHHEAEIRSLQARLSNAAAELTIKEQALAKLKGDLRLEKDKVREQLEEWQHSEAALSGQLQASEQKLKSAEALLLEKTQELRDLEMQQALQRDRQKEVQRLQERIADLSQQLSASEQAQRLMEEKLQRNYELLLESCEKEKQVLLRNLKEVEDKASAYEDQLQDHEQQLEVLQKEKLSAKCEGSEVVRRLEERLEMKEASIQKLAEHVQSLRDERDLIRQRFQELRDRVALSDGDLAELQEKLRGREADYQSLEHSYRRVASQLQSMHTLLKDKEEELKHIKEVHEKVLEKKDQDLNEALVKMVALGSSLEETEMKLQAKEEILRTFAKVSSEDTEEPRSSLEEAEEAGFVLSGPELPATGASPGLPHSVLEEEDPGAAPGEERGDSSPQREDGVVPLKSEVPDGEGHLQSTAKPDPGVPGVKRQRIRFSTIQCQKYTHPDGSEKTWTSSTSSDTSQDRSPSEESMSSEATPSSLPATSDSDTYLSIIHSLETKLYITEEKLKDVTVKLESQQGQSQEALLALHQQWASTEARLREQLHASLLQVGALASQLEQERQARAKVVEDHVGELGDFQVKNSQALACLENCREQLRSLPGASQEEAQDVGASPLASVESALVSTIQALHHWPAPTDSGAHAQLEEGSFLERGKATSQQPPHQPELTEEEQLKLLSDQIALEASLINQIADSLKNTTSDISRILHEIAQSGKLPLESESAAICPGAPADTWAKKVLVDGEFWSQVESLSKHLGTLAGEATGASGGGQRSIPQALVPALADATWVRAELSFAVQSVRESFQRRLQSVQETLRGTRTALQQHKCMLGEILGAYRTPDFERVMQQVSEALEFPAGVEDGAQASWDLSLLGEMLSRQDAALTQEPFHLSDQSSGALVAIQEELALQLKDKASLLGEISAALTSLPPVESVRDCQKLLQASRNLSYNTCLGGLGQYSSLLVQDAIIQAQVCYAACKIRLEYEKERQCYQESRQSRAASCQEHQQAAGALREQYEELLRKQKSEYLEVIAIVERQNAELKAKVTQLDHQQKCLEEVESKHSENIFALQGRYEEEIRCVVEQLNRAENTLQAEHSRVLSQLDASVRDRQDMERHHVEQMQTLEDKFQLKIKELQTIHEEELRTLQEHYSQSLQCLQEALCRCQTQHPEALPAPSPPSSPHQPRGALQAVAGEAEAMTGLRERIQELEAQMDVMREELEHKDLEGSAATLREKYQKDFENLKATCERGFAAMEETHQKKIEDLQRQHQRELEKLREEKDRLLAEETAATISAIEAMKNAHREEMERELEKSQRSQISSINSDVEALRRQYLEELQSVQRELEVLSEQYSQKCLENAHLAQALEAERQALRQCQRENQELNAHNQELNNRLAAEIARLRTLLTGDAGGEAIGSPLTQGKDAYELEVLLRVKESEIQYLKQEISSLKDELQTALRDKKYASDKYKDIYTELSIVRAKADCDISRLKEQLKAATEALGEKSPENTPVSGYDIMKSKSNPDFLKKDRSCVSRQLRNIRSKSVIEQVSWDN